MPDSPLHLRVIVTAPNEGDALHLAADKLGVFPEFVRQVGKAESVGTGVTAEYGYDAEQMAADGAAICEALLNRMGLRARVRILRRHGLPFVDVAAGRDGQLVIGRNGQNIDAIQTVVNRMLVRCKTEQILLAVDCEDYLDRHRQRLVGLAFQAATEAEATGQPVHLAPMPPGDRKMIHNLFTHHATITTASDGEQFDRHVVISIRLGS
jgi:spoIIIJ-associated protein